MIAERIAEQRLQGVGGWSRRLGVAHDTQSLVDRIEELERLLGLARLPLTVLHLGASEEALLGMLLTGRLVARECAHVAIYGGLIEADQPDLKVIEVWVCKLRKKLRVHGIAVATKRGQGYYMDAANRAACRRLLEASVP